MAGDNLVGVPTAGLSCGSARGAFASSVCEVSFYFGTILLIHTCIVCFLSPLCLTAPWHEQRGLWL